MYRSPAPHLTRASRGDRNRAQLLGPHHSRGGQHGDVGDGVEREAQSVPRRDDEEAGERGAEDPRGVRHRAVEGDRVGDVVERHHLVDERTSDGVVEREHAAAGQRGGVERHQRGVADERQRAQGEGLAHLQRLGDVEQHPLVEPVGDHPSPRGQHQDRTELARREYPDREPAARAVQHEQRQGHHGEPVPAVGDQLTDEEQSEVPHPKRRERSAGDISSSRRLTRRWPTPGAGYLRWVAPHQPRKLVATLGPALHAELTDDTP